MLHRTLCAVVTSANEIGLMTKSLDGDSKAVMDIVFRTSKSNKRASTFEQRPDSPNAAKAFPTALQR